MEKINENVKRTKQVSLLLNKPVFLLIDPISEELIILIDIHFIAGNPNVNNYNEVRGKNITTLICDNWFSFFSNNIINDVLLTQSMEKIPSESYLFPINWIKWENFKP